MPNRAQVFWFEASPEQREILARTATGSLKNSTWTLSVGAGSTEFHDVDDFITGRTQRLSSVSADAWTEAPAETIKAFLDVLASSCLTLVKKHAIQRLVFIEKGDEAGPIGLLALVGSLIERTNLAVAIVRLDRKLRSSSFKGKPVERGERFLVMSDVATSGENIAEAADVIWAFGGLVPAALVVYDRQQGATRNLSAIDVELNSLYSHDVLTSEKLTQTDRLDPIIRDFGGVSVSA